MPLLLDPDSTEHSWWAGVRLPLVAAVVAVTAAVAPIKGQSLRQIAQVTATQHQDEIPLSTQHAGFYETRPLYSVIRWEVDTSEQAFGLHGPPDDDQVNRKVLALSQANRYLQPWSVDTQFVPKLLHVEDEYWINPDQPLLRAFAYPQPWAGEQNEEATGLHGIPDVDQTRQSVLSCSQANVYPQPWSTEADTQLYGLPDINEQWTNPNSPLVRSFNYPQQWLFDIQEPAGSLFGLPDENELWQNPLKPLNRSFAWIQQWPFDEQFPLLFGTPDENELNQRTLTISRANVYPQPWADNADTQLFVFVPDEDFGSRLIVNRPWLVGRAEPWAITGDTAPQQDYPPDIWINPNQPLVRVFNYPQPASFDEQIPVHPVPGDDDQVRQSVISRNQANVYPEPWNDASDTKLFNTVDDESAGRIVVVRPWIDKRVDVWAVTGDSAPQQVYPPDIWINPNEPLVRLFVYPQQWTFDEQTPLLYGTPDENETNQRTLSLSRTFIRPEPFAFDTGTRIPPVSTLSADEDFWVNSAAIAWGYELRAAIQRRIAIQSGIDVANEQPTPKPGQRHMYVTRMVEVLNLDAFPEKG